ncbi:MAG: hypothetical protein ACI4VH_01630 [Clostridia bacterium]
MEKPILKCEKLNKKFGKKRILKDVSFEVFEGDILGFIGPNGARKDHHYQVNTWSSKYYRRKSSYQWI